MTITQDTNGQRPAHADHPYMVTLWWRPVQQGAHRHCTWSAEDEPCTPYTFRCIGARGSCSTDAWVPHLIMVDKPLPEQGVKHQAWMAGKLRSELSSIIGLRVPEFHSSLIMEPR